MSIWDKNSIKISRQIQKSSIKTDVLIIGGGITGILCAYELKTRGVDCLIVERDTVCNGVTHNTTAKITAQHSLIYHKLLKHSGIQKAQLYLESNLNAVKKYTDMCQNIDCDFEIKDNYIYTRYDKKVIDAELKALTSLGYNPLKATSLPLPFDIECAIGFHEQAQFNPLKFLYNIAAELPVYEHTKVKEYKGSYITTNENEIIAKNIIAATHFPVFNKHGLYPVKMYQERSYVIALKNAPDVNGMYIDESEVGLSLRNYADVLLLGGGSHRTGKNGGKWDHLRQAKEKYFPDAQEIDHWATQDCITLDEIPYIGLYSKNTDNCFVATGFNKWGMTSSMVAAEIIADMIQGKYNKYTKLYNPSRNIIKPKLISNAFESAMGLLSPFGKRCPHLGCKLKWNKEEHTWDCPCHGSRFSENGKLIDSPANDDLKQKNGPEKY